MLNGVFAKRNRDKGRNCRICGNTYYDKRKKKYCSDKCANEGAILMKIRYQEIKRYDKEQKLKRYVNSIEQNERKKNDDELIWTFKRCLKRCEVIENLLKERKLIN